VRRAGITGEEERIRNCEHGCGSWPKHGVGLATGVSKCCRSGKDGE
jgi:hypothetical protein